MSKLDREITAVIDDIGNQAKDITPKLLMIMIDDDLSDTEKTSKMEKMIKESLPKTYETYIADLKQVFKEAGWKEPV